MRLFPREGVAADAASAQVHVIVLHSEAPAVERRVVIVPRELALGLHLAYGGPAGGLEEDRVTNDI